MTNEGQIRGKEESAQTRACIQVPGPKRCSEVPGIMSEDYEMNPLELWPEEGQDEGARHGHLSHPLSQLYPGRQDLRCSPFPKSSGAGNAQNLMG